MLKVTGGPSLRCVMCVGPPIAIAGGRHVLGGSLSGVGRKGGEEGGYWMYPGPAPQDVEMNWDGGAEILDTV